MLDIFSNKFEIAYLELSHCLNVVFGKLITFKYILKLSKTFFSHSQTFKFYNPK